MTLIGKKLNQNLRKRMIYKYFAQHVVTPTGADDAETKVFSNLV